MRPVTLTESGPGRRCPSYPITCALAGMNDVCPCVELALACLSACLLACPMGCRACVEDVDKLLAARAIYPRWDAAAGCRRPSVHSVAVEEGPRLLFDDPVHLQWLPGCDDGTRHGFGRKRGGGGGQAARPRNSRGRVIKVEGCRESQEKKKGNKAC